MDRKEKEGSDVLVTALLVGVGYFLVAYLSLFLAIPPGFASPIWPAAGLAFAIVLSKGWRCLPGVFLGSLAINLYISVDGGGAWFDPMGVIIASLIAFGACLQAFVSAWLVLRYMALPQDLESIAKLPVFFLIGGPLGCLINSIWGTSTLFLFGVLDPGRFLGNWFTWWMGDTLGVVCFAHTIVLLAAQEKSVRHVRKWIVGVSHLTVFALVVMAVSHMKKIESQRLDLRFDRDSQDLVHLLEEEFAAYQSGLLGMELLTAQSNTVNQEEFERLVLETFGARSLNAVAMLIRKVDRGGRAAFESSMRNGGFSDFEIRRQYPDGNYERAPERDIYFPAEMAVGGGLAAASIGSDFGDWLEKNELLGSSGGLSAKPSRFHLGGFPDFELMSFRPILKNSEHTGFVAIRVPVADFLAGVIDFSGKNGLCFALVEKDGEGERRLFDSLLKKADGTSSEGTRSQRESLSATGLDLEIEIAESSEFVSRNDSESIWIALTSGSLFSAVLGLCLLIVTGRTEAVERIVERRTAELNAKALQLERSNEGLEELAVQADAANVAKSQFIASMSHEIRTPMNGLLGILHLLKDELDGDKLSLLDTAQKSADDLLVLINDILDFSKIEAGKMTVEFLDVDVLQLIEEVCELHAPSACAKGLQLSNRVRPEASRIIRSDPYRLKQIVSNLLSNAVKFTDKGVVSLDCSYVETEKESQIRIQVNDTGIGISKEGLSRLFECFTQADSSMSRRYGGTGLGLSISMRLSDLLGGTIEVDSSVGTGSCFSLVLGKQEPCRLSELTRAFNLEGRRALIALSDADAFQHLLDWLEHWGVAVDHCSFEEFQGVTAFPDVDYSIYIFEYVDWLALPDKPAASATILCSESSIQKRPLDLPANTYLLRYPPSIGNLRQILLGPDSLISHQKLTETKLDMSPYSESSVLVVDDIITNRLVVTGMLQKLYGLKAETANDGAEALQRLKDSRFDLVFMDCMMPVLDGYEASRALRAGEAGGLNQYTPIVALTANAMEDERGKCEAAGMNDYIAKPVVPDSIRGAFQKWIVEADNSSQSAV